MKLLVIAGTGTIGGRVVRGLLDRNLEVRVLCRPGDDVGLLAADVEGAVGEPLDAASYASFFDGIDTLVLLGVVFATELHLGLTAIAEARRVGVRRLVHLSVLNAERGAHIPHFASKLAVEHVIRASGIPYTILRPGNFYQTDTGIGEAIRHGIYPQPLGDAGVARVDARDVADAAVRAVVERGHENATYALVGETLTGEASARVWAEVLGSEVRFGGNDLDAWASSASARLPSWLVYELRLLFQLFHAGGFLPSGAQHEESLRAIGHSPRPYRDFVSETVTGWKRTAKHPATEPVATGLTSAA